MKSMLSREDCKELLTNSQDIKSTIGFIFESFERDLFRKEDVVKRLTNEINKLTTDKLIREVKLKVLLKEYKKEDK